MDLYFGGSFNPLHHGHLICARAVAEAAGYHRVVLVPSAQPPHKPGQIDLALPQHRLEMCLLTVSESPIFEVSDLEVRRNGASYTIDTVRQLRGQGKDVAWLIGADMLAILPQWHQAEALLEEARIVVMARPGWNFDWPSLPPRFRALEANVVAAPLIQISGSDIRRRLRAGLPITYLTPAPVCRYIQERGLYR